MGANKEILGPSPELEASFAKIRKFGAGRILADASIETISENICLYEHNMRYRPTDVTWGQVVAAWWGARQQQLEQEDNAAYRDWSTAHRADDEAGMDAADAKIRSIRSKRSAVTRATGIRTK